MKRQSAIYKLKGISEDLEKIRECEDFSLEERRNFLSIIDNTDCLIEEMEQADLWEQTKEEWHSSILSLHPRTMMMDFQQLFFKKPIFRAWGNCDKIPHVDKPATGTLLLEARIKFSTKKLDKSHLIQLRSESIEIIPKSFGNLKYFRVVDKSEEKWIQGSIDHFEAALKVGSTRVSPRELFIISSMEITIPVI